MNKEIQDWIWMMVSSDDDPCGSGGRDTMKNDSENYDRRVMVFWLMFEFGAEIVLAKRRSKADGQR